ADAEPEPRVVAADTRELRSAEGSRMTNVVIAGAKGRMGQALIACATRFPDIQVSGTVDLGDSLEQVIPGANVIIDFSFHNATLGVAELCARHKCALVI